MFSSKAGFQRDFSDMSYLGPDMSGELYNHCNLNSTGLVYPFSRHVWVLTQLWHMREISSMSDLSWFGDFILVLLIYWTGLLWQLQWLVFQIPIKDTPPSFSWVAGSRPFAYSFNNLLSSLQPLFVRSKSFVEDSSVGWRDLCVIHLSSSLEHFGLHQAFMKHLLLLEVKPARRLDIALELPSMWWVLGKFMKVGFTSERKEAS
jgi:hypothetical protein